MLGTWVNVAAVLIGGSIGLLIQKGLSQRLADTLMKGLALCTITIGISGALDGRDTLKLILSVVIGALLGELLDLDGKIQRLGEWVERRFSKGTGGVSIAEGFVTASLLFCVGAMAIVGSIQDGILGGHATLFAKAVLDLVIIMVMTASMGKGCIFSAIPVGILQGSVTLLARLLQPVFTDAALSNLSLVGSVLVFCVGLNLVWGKKIRVANLLPSLLIAVIWAFL